MTSLFAHLPISNDAEAPVAGAATYMPCDAHLRGMQAASAASLKGAGSRPMPRVSMADAEAWTELKRLPASNGSEDRDVTSALNTLLCQAFAALLSPPPAAVTDEQSDVILVSEAEMTAPAVETDKERAEEPASKRLAAQMSVVARINQPKSRAANASAVKSAKKTATAVEAARIAKSKLAGRKGLKKGDKPETVIAPAGRGPAVIIDLAAIRLERRSRTSRRAA